MKIAGIDEAGRGPVIGPMVLCGVMIDNAFLEKFETLQVRDSKLLARKKREIIYEKLISDKNITIKTIIVWPSEIDTRFIAGLNLNTIELNKILKLIKILNPDRVYIDSPDVKPGRFIKNILDGLNKKIEIIAEHKADVKYPIVSAASIIAKVKRDMIIDELKTEFGDFGSGYPSDKKTINFLIEWFKKTHTWPSIVRTSWKTIKEIEQILDKNQLKLNQF